MTHAPQLKWRDGGCHCGAVRFSAALPDRIEVEDCNCSICAKSRNAHIIIPAARFKLVSGARELRTYTFNTRAAQHKFCRICGVKSFYIPRSNPDGVAITWRCLDAPQDFTSIQINPFDGVNWEANAAALADKSRHSGDTLTPD